MHATSWQAAIGFTASSDLIAYKETELTPVSAFITPTTQFFIANPVRDIYAQRPGSIDNIAAFKNIVVEFDGMPVSKQNKLVMDYALPAALATFSGNKSNHYIISVQEGFSSLEEYTFFARAVYAVMGGAPDPKCKNPNRLTRVPGSIRADTGNEQTLLFTGAQISKQQLLHWLSFTHARRYAKFLQQEAREEEQRRLRSMQVRDTGPTPLPRIYLDVLEEGALHPETTSRHDTLVKFGAWLIHNGYTEEQLADYLEQASDALGLTGRDDARTLTQYFARKISL